MMDSMSWDQFMEWAAFYEISPFGEERADLRAGVIASTIANVNRDPRKGKSFQPSDFTLKFSSGSGKVASGKKEPITDPEEWARVKAMARAFAG
jgi:hypothetical protein